MQWTMSSRIQTVINLMTGIITMLVTLIINFFLSSYIVAVLGEEANGFTQLANNFVTYASLLTLAFNSMASRFISVCYHEKRMDKVRKYYSSVIVCNIVMTVILLPIAIATIFNLEKLIVIENVHVEHVKILFGCVFVNFFANLAVSVFSISTFVLNKIYFQNIINTLRAVFNGILLLVLFGLLKPRIYYVSLCSMILTLIAIPAYMLIQKKLMPQLKFSIRDFSGKAVSQMLKSGIWNTVNQGGNMLMTGLDLLLANVFVSPAMMGLLSVAKVVPNAIISLASTLNTNFAPEIVIQFSKHNKEEMLRTLRSNMKISSVLISIPIMTFCSFGVAFYSMWVPSLDAKALTILSFLTCMSFIPSAGTQTLYNVFTATNHLKVNSVAFLSTGVLNLAFVYFLLSHSSLGIYAIAGVSSTLTIIRNLVVTIPYTAKLLELPWYEFYKDVIISLFCCGINFVVAFIVQAIVPTGGWLNLIIAVFFTCGITLVADLFIVLNREERKKIIIKLKRGKENG